VLEDPNENEREKLLAQARRVVAAGVTPPRSPAT
jgi:hypothetical protein